MIKQSKQKRWSECSVKRHSFPDELSLSRANKKQITNRILHGISHELVHERVCHTTLRLVVAHLRVDSISGCLPAVLVQALRLEDVSHAVDPTQVTVVRGHRGRHEAVEAVVECRRAAGVHQAAHGVVRERERRDGRGRHLGRVGKRVLSRRRERRRSGDDRRRVHEVPGGLRSGAEETGLVRARTWRSAARSDIPTIVRRRRPRGGFRGHSEAAVRLCQMRWRQGAAVSARLD